MDIINTLNVAVACLKQDGCTLRQNMGDEEDIIISSKI